VTMAAGVRQLGSGDGRLFPEGRIAGPMPWVIAIMMFLTVLAAAAGLGLSAAASRMEAQIGNRVTIQILEAAPAQREAQARAAEAALRASAGVREVRRVPDAEVAALLEPWLGDVAAEAEVPVPAMIDVDLEEGGRSGLASLRETVLRAAPAAVVADAADWLGPLGGLMASLQWLAAGLVLLMVGATAATVVLAARASLNTHNQTIEILHLMGATDHQIARLFQRRIALDVLSGGLLGFAIGVAVLVLIGGRVEAIGSELLGTLQLPDYGWVVLVLLPLGGALLALLVARVTILRALGRWL
jgi:cell division transport system permease protein